jgi:tetratricopeptide (TPR) repeat protein
VLYKALEINPKYVYAWYDKGLALRKLGKYNEAILAMMDILAMKNRDMVLKRMGEQPRNHNQSQGGLLG